MSTEAAATEVLKNKKTNKNHKCQQEEDFQMMEIEKLKRKKESGK
jgi:hypothetical protein